MCFWKSAVTVCKKRNNIQNHKHIEIKLLQCIFITYSNIWKKKFYAPAWKVRRGHLVIGSSVCLFVRNSAPLTNKVQYLKFGWWHSNQTWSVGSSMGSSYFTDITCPWGGAGSKCRTNRFFSLHILTLLVLGAFVFHKHMSSYIILERLSLRTCTCTSTCTRGFPYFSCVLRHHFWIPRNFTSCAWRVDPGVDVGKKLVAYILFSFMTFLAKEYSFGSIRYT